MGIQHTDRTLPTNRMIFDVRRDMALYQKFRQNPDAVMEQYKLSPAEKKAVKALDLLTLDEMGVHPYFLPQLTRLFHGSADNHNASAALDAFYRSIVARERAGGRNG